MQSFIFSSLKALPSSSQVEVSKKQEASRKAYRISYYYKMHESISDQSICICIKTDVSVHGALYALIWFFTSCGHKIFLPVISGKFWKVLGSDQILHACNNISSLVFCPLF